jgi:uncharacterized membrane protein YfcA
MDIYLPIAEMSVPLEAVVGLGLVVGFLSAIFGVGGGFLATPFLIFMGVPPSIAVGTQANQLVAASLTGALGHWSRKHVDVKLGLYMLSGSFAGSLLGVLIFRLLQHLGQIDVVINILYVVLLLTIGGMMFFESVSVILKRKKTIRLDLNIWQKLNQKLPYQTHFPTSRLMISALMPAIIGFFGGILVSIMGIGGGFFLVPAMIYILGMPSMMVAGTSLFQIFFTTSFTTILQAITNKTVDLTLAVMLIIGSVIGAQIGIRISPYIKGAPARFGLAIMLILVATKLGFDLFLMPKELFSLQVRG